MNERRERVDKEKDFSAWFDYILQEAQLVDSRYGVKGFVVYRPNAMRIVKKIYSLLERELEATGHQQVLFPLVIPLSAMRKESEHIRGFEDQVFIISEASGGELDEKLVLRPTSETAVYPMCSLWIRSYQDLPLKMYQSVAVYRRETRATRPLLRAREFLWVETHDLFATEEEAKAQVMEDLEIAKRVYEKLGIAYIVAEREPFDRFPGADNSYAYDALLPNGHVLQVGTTHLLGQHFTKAYDVTFLDKRGERRVPYSTCFGPGVSRILAALIATHGDDRGLVLPFGMAQYDVVVVPIPYRGGEPEVEEKAKRLGQALGRDGYAVYVDISEETPGSKYYRWELKGIPVRLEVGKEEVREGTVTVFRRDTGTRVKVRDSELKETMKRLKKEIPERLRERAWENLGKRLVKAGSREDVLRQASEGMLILAPFCGERECAEEIKSQTGGYEVRGRDVNDESTPSQPCAWCGRPAKRRVYLARAF
jgi:prolyl-tRNA synthetase